MIQTEEVNVNL